jgi:hypothetical protein
MTYRLMNHEESYVPATEAARFEQSRLPWQRALSGVLWGATCGYLLESLRRRALRAEHRLPQPDWERQIRRELLRIEARRIL